MVRIRKIFSPPVFPDDEDKTRQVRVLNTLVVSSILFLVFYGIIGIPFIFVEKLYNSLTVLALLVILGVSYQLMRRGRVRLASALFVSAMWLVFTLFLLFAGGTTSVVVVFYLVGTVIAGLLLGMRSAMVQVVACCLAGLGMVILETSDHPLPRIFPVPPIVGWIDMTVALLATTVILRLVLNDLHEALLLTRQRLEERKQADEALRESEEKFRRLFETSRDFLYITNVAGEIIEINKAASTLSGYSVDELKTINIQELYFDPNDRDLVVKEISERGFMENLEVKGKRKDGTVVDALVNSTVIKDDAGKVAGFQGSIKDITERKQAEQKLRESEERYRSLFEGVPVGLYRTMLSGQILDFNLAGIRMLGYEDREEVITHNANDFWVDPEAREQLASQMDRDGTFDLEIQMRRRDQKIIWVHNRGRGARDEQGQILYYEGSLEDITERKQAEDGLQESEARYRAISELMSDYTFSTRVESDGRIVPQWVAGAFQQITGYAWEEFIALGSWPRIVYPDDLPADQLDLEALLENRPINREIRIVTKSGEVRWVQNFVRPVWDDQQGRVTELIGAVRDISERKRAEEALKESEKLFRALIENSTDAIIMVDRAWIILYVSPSHERITGYRPEQRLGRDLFEVIHPDDCETISQLLVGILDVPGQVNLGPIRSRHADGSWRWIEAVARNLLNEPSVQAVVINFRDITERTRAEEQIRAALAEKENLLRELYHRTKNNMGVIIALLELQSGYFDDERLQAAFTDTENRIRSMALVHQKLYETSDLSHINLKDYINDLMQLLMNSYRTSPERVSVVADMEDVLVLIDTAIPCGLILNELISNAFKHAFPAGRAGKITVNLRRLENGAIQLRVADDGVGLPPGFDARRDGQMGLKTIFALAEHQLKAQVSFDIGQGVSCQLQFKDNLYQPRI